MLNVSLALNPEELRYPSCQTTGSYQEAKLLSQKETHPKNTAMVNALGIKYHVITFDEIIERITTSKKQSAQLLIGYANLHGAFVALRSPEFSNFAAQADIFYADGMPLIAWRKLLWGDVSRKHRSTLSQTLPKLLRSLSEESLRVFWLGGEPKVIADGLSRLRNSHPELIIQGRHGYFDKKRQSSENTEVIKIINRFKPDVLIVGMGMPAQEIWIMENKSDLNASVIYAAGAAIEYFSEYAPRPPRWASDWGLEWAYRLVSQPYKWTLWRRYLIEPWCLIGPALADIVTRLRTRKRR